MRLLVIDDHALVREGVAAVLRNAWVDTVVLQAQTSAAALELMAANADIDMVLLDLMMPDRTGVEVLKDFGSRHPGVPVVVLSSSERPEDVRRTLSLGALGFIPKSAPSTTLLAALNFILAGEIYVPPFMASSTVADDQRPPRSASLAAAVAGLTHRQRAVLQLLCSDVQNKEIAFQLRISEKTVKAHVTAIFKALGVASRAQAIRSVLDNHLL